MSIYRLKCRIRRLIKALPKDPPAFEELSEQKIDRVTSTILLSSAEFEDFVEERIADIIEASFSAWTKNKTLSPPLIAFMHEMHPAKGKSTIKNVEKVFSHDVNCIINLSYKAAQVAISKSHGLNEDSLQKLLNMVGADTDALHTEISILASFTRKRGAIAHKGHGKHGITIVNLPTSVKAELESALSAIRTIDLALSDTEKLIPKKK